MTTTITLIPLNKLTLSEHNARRDPGDVSKLARSIHAHGLITALSVAKAGRKYAVFAGGRRLAALQHLQFLGHIEKAHEVPCVVFDSASAAASLAENVEREPMDPVQQFQAFGRLLGEGQTVHEIAEAFSVTPQYVRQRAKLAELVPEAIQAWRTGRARLDQLEALTYGTPEQQRAICEEQVIPSAYILRERLRGATVMPDDPRVKLVSLDSYTAAGGGTIDDLFQNVTHLTDPALLDRLVDERVEAERQACLAEGAAWVELKEHPFQKGYVDPPSHLDDSPECVAERNELERLAKQAGADDGDVSDDALQRVCEARRKLHDAVQRHTIIDRSAPYGVILYILQHSGALMRAYKVRAADLPKAPPGATAPTAPSAADQPAGADALTKSGIQQIAAARQHAIAHALAGNAHVARAVLLQQLDWSLWGSPRQAAGELTAGASWGRPGPMQISTTAATKIDMARRRAWDRRAPYRDMLSPPEHIPLRYYIDQGDCTQILADCIGTLLQDPDIDAPASNAVPPSTRATIRELLDVLAIDMADHWQPDEAWLRGYGKAATLDALAECGLTEQASERHGSDITKAKAAQIYPIAADLLSSARWLPTYARGGHTDGR